MLVAKNIKHNYFGTGQSLDIEDFCLDEGEFAVVVGGSGSGKTELIKCLTCLEKISGGELTLNGEQLDSIKPKDRKMAMTFEDYGFFQWKSVEGNLIHSDKLRRHDKYDSMAKAEILAENFHFIGKLFNPMRMLNDYYRAKVSIARAFMREDAEYFFFDNPLSKLKIEEREDVFGLFYENLSMIKGSVLYATNSVDEAFRLNKKTYFLSSGKILDVGTVVQLSESKHYEIHREFNKGRYNYLLFEGDLPVSARGGDPKSQIAAVKICDAAIEKSGGDGISIPAVIIGETYVCGERVIEVTTGEHRLFAKFTEGYSVGQNVNIVIKPENIILLDKI